MSLTLRIALVLTVALLPLGLIAILQSQQALDSLRDTFRATLSAETVRVARPEREAIEEAFGLVEGLGGTLTALSPDDEACSLLMQTIAERNPEIRFLGVISPDGVSRCNNDGTTFEFAETPASRALFQNPQRSVRFNPSGQVTGAPVIIVSDPVNDSNGDFIGFVSLSFVSPDMAAEGDIGSMNAGLSVITLNGEGEILMAHDALDEAEAMLPRGIAAGDLPILAGETFSGETIGGEMREFTVVPIVENRAYLLGSRTPGLPGSEGVPLSLSGTYLPIAMWIVTLAVAVYALRREVIAPIKTLRMRIRNFADGRTIFRANSLGGAPRELREIGMAFERMADKIVRDEAIMEDKLHERSLLLREVHHRVKNNLQMMSSIINLQARKAEDASALAALRSVQGRLASLAKFHQDLYETSSLSRLRADELLADLARQSLALGADPKRPVQLKLELDEVVLSPDQASPLAMLTTEAMTNALKYAGAPDGESPDVVMRLTIERTSEGEFVLWSMENAVDPEASDEATPSLGTRLMSAFAMQLDSKIETERAEGRHCVHVRFLRRSLREHENGTKG